MRGEHPGTRGPEENLPAPQPGPHEPRAIVGVHYLNARPLLAGLEEGVAAPFRYCFATAEPAECAVALACGTAAAALVPVAALPNLGTVRVVPNLGIACRGAVTSVLLVTRVPLPAIRRLAAHAASLTSITLARLLLAERWGARPLVVPARPPLEAMLAEAEAAVLIGDPALSTIGTTGLCEVDLGDAWQAWTGLPFVFAVWAARAEAPAALDTLLDASLAHAEANWERLVPVWAAAHRQSPDKVRRYLRETLHFRLDDEDRRATEAFLRRAAAAGVLPPGPRGSRCTPW